MLKTYLLIIVISSVLYGIDIELVTIPSGYFNMNNSFDKYHMDFVDSSIIVEYAFEDIEIFVKTFNIGKYEVTQSEWKEVMGWDAPSFIAGERLPVSSISWFDAVLFCNELSKREKMDTVYSYTTISRDQHGVVNLNELQINWHTKGYRLPTEAEWEYAARGGSKYNFYWGDTASIESLSVYANFQGNSERIPELMCKCYKVQNVGLKKSNAFGLHDMNGNVSEWCNGWFGWFGESFSFAAPYSKEEKPFFDKSIESFDQKKADCQDCEKQISTVRIEVFDRKKIGIEERVVSTKPFCKIIRGGDVNNANIDDFRLGKRSWSCPTESHDYTGFRVVLVNY